VTRETHWNGERVVWRPQPVPDGQHHAAQRLLADLDHELRPAERDWISGRIATLLAHYWTPDMPHKLQAAVAGDWVVILGELPRGAIEAACRRYLCGETRARPTPGQIRSLAREEIADELLQRDRLRDCLEGGKAPARRGGVRPLGNVTKEAALAESARIRGEMLASMTDKERAAYDRDMKARGRAAHHQRQD
jgi:hypothetical protein